MLSLMRFANLKIIFFVEPNSPECARVKMLRNLNSKFEFEILIRITIKINKFNLVPPWVIQATATD
jgi:hypothetical protein